MTRAIRLFLLVALLAAAAPASAQPPVWVVHGPDTSVVLFGSVHLLPPGLDWEPPALRQALAKADDLWFEIPIDPAASLSAAQYATRRGVLPPGARLSDELTPKNRARLDNAARACGLPIEGLEHLRPWYADIALSVASYRGYGAGLENGVEQTLSAANPRTQRKAFETVEEQIAFLADAPEPDQLASLVETLGEIEEGPAVYERLVKAWMAGDAAAIQREALDPLIEQAPGVYHTLVVERNRRWLQRIRARLAGHGEAVIVVGVGHLIGPDSVPALLRQAGYEVDGP